jgi:hypothetical protein
VCVCVCVCVPGTGGVVPQGLDVLCDRDAKTMPRMLVGNPRKVFIVLETPRVVISLVAGVGVIENVGWGRSADCFLVSDEGQIHVQSSQRSGVVPPPP